MHVRDEFAELIAGAFESPHTEDVQTVFCQCAGFVEADDVDFTGDVDSIRRDAEDRCFSEPADGETCPDG